MERQSQESAEAAGPASLPGAAGHWNVGGRWEDLWACQAPFRDGLNAYLAAGNTSTRRRSLAEIYGCGAAARRGGPTGCRDRVLSEAGCRRSAASAAADGVGFSQSLAQPYSPFCLALSCRSGEHHPEVAEELLAALAAPYTADTYPTPAMRAVGLACGCSWWFADPCRTEFRQARWVAGLWVAL